MKKHLDQRFRLIETLLSLKVLEKEGPKKIDEAFKEVFVDSLCYDSEQNEESLRLIEYAARPIYRDCPEGPLEYGLSVVEKETTLANFAFELENFLVTKHELLDQIREEVFPALQVEEIQSSLRLMSLLIDALRVREIEV